MQEELPRLAHPVVGTVNVTQLKRGRQNASPGFLALRSGFPRGGLAGPAQGCNPANGRGIREPRWTLEGISSERVAQCWRSFRLELKLNCWVCVVITIPKVLFARLHVVSQHADQMSNCSVSRALQFHLHKVNIATSWAKLSPYARVASLTERGDLFNLQTHISISFFLLLCRKRQQLFSFYKSQGICSLFLLNLRLLT